MNAPEPLRFDEAASAALEQIYLTPDIVAPRRATLAALDLRPGERVLDLGCGPGLPAAEMAVRVGSSGVVHGADISPDMLADRRSPIAARPELSAGAARLAPSTQDVSALDLPDGAFDVALCTQVYEYVADMPVALSEARRVLAPGGRLVVLDTDWDSIVWRSSDDARMARVLAAWDEHLVHRDVPRRLPELLSDAGFAVTGAEVAPILNIGTRGPSYSAGMRELIAAFVAGRAGVDADQVAAWGEDLRDMGARYFFSFNRYLFAATRDREG